MGQNRVRSRTTKYSGVGKKVTFIKPSYTVTENTSAVPLEYEYCSDYISSPPHPDQPLLLYKKVVKPVLANGTSTSLNTLGQGTTYTYTNYRFLRSQTGYCPSVPSPNWTHLRTKALARLNPNVPPVDIPNFLWELRELPQLLRDGIRAVNADRWSDKDLLPGSFLAYHFGLKPLLSDLRGLLNFAASWEERIRRLYQAGKARKYRGNLLRIRNSTSLASMPWTVPYSVGATNVVRRLDRDHSSWFTCDLNPTVSFPRFETQYMEQFDFALKTGISTANSLSSVWNSVPWTWLIDYFLNIGDFLEANAGSLPYTVTNMCIMYRSVDTEVHEVYRVGRNGQYGSVWSYTDDVQTPNGFLRTDAKQRYVSAIPTPGIWYDFGLSDHQRNILAALVSARLLGNRASYNG